MRFDIFTLLPDTFAPYLQASILQKASERGLVEFRVHNIRDYTHDRHHTTDDTPYGGGGGMVMKPEPVFEAVESVVDNTHKFSMDSAPGCPVILMTPQGRVFNQKMALELSAHPRIALLCGRYEGVDERLIESSVDEEISIGDYVLSGGELPTMVVMDAIIRQLPGVLGDDNSAIEDSFVNGLLDCPHYTRPEVYEGSKVPDVLLSGNHARISAWRLQQSLALTKVKRPDLLAARLLTKEETRLLQEIDKQEQDSI